MNRFHSFKRDVKKSITAVRRKLNSGKDYIGSKVDIINWLGKQYNYTSYLQISTYTTGGFFDQISDTQFTVKECLNYRPANGIFDNINAASFTNDHSVALQTYEEAWRKVRQKQDTYDVIFVDSFHSFEQSNQDLLVAMSLLSEQGTIVVHDCYPKKEQHVGNEWHPGTWLGQTYESFIQFRTLHPEVETSVVGIDYGCGLIRPGQPAFRSIHCPDHLTLADLTAWGYFSKHARELLNLIDPEQFKQHYAAKHLVAAVA